MCRLSAVLLLFNCPLLQDVKINKPIKTQKTVACFRKIVKDLLICIYCTVMFLFKILERKIREKIVCF